MTTGRSATADPVGAARSRLRGVEEEIRTDPTYASSTHGVVVGHERRGAARSAATSGPDLGVPARLRLLGDRVLVARFVGGPTWSRKKSLCQRRGTSSARCSRCRSRRFGNVDDVEAREHAEYARSTAELNRPSTPE
jgi:hypothetical protein